MIVAGPWLCLICTLAVLQAQSVQKLPVNFCRSGRAVRLRVRADVRGPVELRAFGRTWCRPGVPDKGGVKLTVPKVRVPTLFQITTRDRNRTVGEVVAYPGQRAHEWPVATTVRVSHTTTVWFREWVVAVGLPFKIERFDEQQKDRRDLQSAKLLIVAGESARASLPALQHRFSNCRANLLVLNAAWFANGQVRKTSLLPSGLSDMLQHMRDQKWGRPVIFDRHAGPWTGVSNRWTVIGHGQSPLVESIPFGQTGRRIVLSYLPWQDQLGRNDIADALFIELLKAASRERHPPKLKRRTVVLWPTTKMISARLRPVLFAIAGASRDNPRLNEKKSQTLHILDLRGPKLSRDDAASIDLSRKGTRSVKRLFVLGTDPGADGGRWSKQHFARTRRQKANRRRAAGIVWLPADAIPSKMADQLHLMRVLTSSGVAISRSHTSKHSK